MISTNTTLVLGAGASIAMGYPTGGELRLELLKLTNVDKRQFSIESGLYAAGEEHLQGFIDAFRRSQMYSIDAFLARRPEFTDIGKRAIAAVLLEREAACSLDRWNHEDGWYQYCRAAFTSTPVAPSTVLP